MDKDFQSRVAAHENRFKAEQAAERDRVKKREAAQRAEHDAIAKRRQNVGAWLAHLPEEEAARFGALADLEPAQFGNVIKAVQALIAKRQAANQREAERARRALEPIRDDYRTAEIAVQEAYIRRLEAKADGADEATRARISTEEANARLELARIEQELTGGEFE